MEGARVSGQWVRFWSGPFGRLAIFTGAILLAPQAKAAIYYWEDSAPVVIHPAPKPQQPHAKPFRHGDRGSGFVLEKESKPQGPLIISISIGQQKLRLYDANGLFAETPISTGMPGHPTPMGVFSVIQKQKFHRSNIYSGAPMPFMQRITWSGVAMHAGVLPGYPASHGCIRMPMGFAVKMYGWTRMGARVIVAPGDVTPASFSHPLLATIKVAPQPLTMQETKTDMAAVQPAAEPLQAKAGAAPAAIMTGMELGATVGHVDQVKSAAEESAPPTAVKTADASAALSAALGKSGEIQHATTASDAAKPINGASAPLPKAAIAPANEAASSPPPAKPASKVTTEIQSHEPVDAPFRSTTSVTLPVTQPVNQAAPPVAATEVPLNDDLDNAKPGTQKTDPGFAFRGSGQIAVFISGKDSKLYIRQNFSPLFQIPVTIAADIRPLGTHIFTARVDGHDANVLHWSVISLPNLSKFAERHDNQRRSQRHRFASAAPTEAKPQPAPDTPAEALDRLSLPPEVMAKVYEAVTTGGSIIVSDQGISAGETGEGTDFIVSLR